MYRVPVASGGVHCIPISKMAMRAVDGSWLGIDLGHPGVLAPHRLTQYAHFLLEAVMRRVYEAWPRYGGTAHRALLAGERHHKGRNQAGSMLRPGKNGPATDGLTAGRVKACQSFTLPPEPPGVTDTCQQGKRGINGVYLPNG